MVLILEESGRKENHNIQLVPYDTIIPTYNSERHISVENTPEFQNRNTHNNYAQLEKKKHFIIQQFMTVKRVKYRESLVGKWQEFILSGTDPTRTETV